MHTECDKFQERINEFMNMSISEAERTGLEMHLENCRQCRKLIEVHMDLKPYLSNYNSETPPEGYFTNLLPNIRNRLESKKNRSPIDYLLGKRYALPLVVTTIIVALIFSVPGSNSNYGREYSNGQYATDSASEESILEYANMHVRDMSIAPLIAQEENILATLDKDLINLQIAKVVFSGYDELGISTYLNGNSLIESMSDQEIDYVVQRLTERTIL